MIRSIVVWPEHLLFEKSHPVEEEEFNGKALADLASDMLNTMTAAGGVGISAVQVGVLKQAAWIRDTDDKPIFLCNFKISVPDEDVHSFVSAREGCLSMPGVEIKTKRYPNVHVIGREYSGKELDTRFTGFPSVVAQHEWEHFQGLTLMDMAGPTQFAQAKERIKKTLRFIKRNHEKMAKERSWRDSHPEATTALTAPAVQREDYEMPAKKVEPPAAK